MKRDPYQLYKKRKKTKKEKYHFPTCMSTSSLPCRDNPVMTNSTANKTK